MALNMKDSGRTVELQVKENCIILMEIIMKVILKMIKLMAKEFMYTETVLDMKELGKMT